VVRTLCLVALEGHGCDGRRMLLVDYDGVHGASAHHKHPLRPSNKRNLASACNASRASGLRGSLLIGPRCIAPAHIHPAIAYAVDMLPALCEAMAEPTRLITLIVDGVVYGYVVINHTPAC